MLELALSGEPAFQVDAREVEREGPSYTIDTLRSLSADHPGAGLVLIVGSDQLAEFQTWREWETILDMVEIAGVARPGLALEGLPEAIASRITPVELPLMPVSSTLIRDRLAAGESIRHLVPPRVHRYIEESGLYRGNTTAQ
jgi:nicotinate-nucleotide adenylyltransferase